MFSQSDAQPRLSDSIAGSAAAVEHPEHLSRRAVLLCVLTTAVVAATELTIGLTFNLLSVTAEGLHTAVDLLTSLFSLYAVIVAAHPPDPNHPYGHGKLDSLAGLSEGLFVAGSGVWAVFAGGRAILGFAPVAPQPALGAVLAMAAASALYVFAARYVLRVARLTGSPVTYAEGMHLLTHVVVTASLVVGLLVCNIAQRLAWPHADLVDPAVAVLLGVTLIIIALRIAARAIRQLIDAAMPAVQREQLVACLHAFADEFVEIHGIRTRQSGSEWHVDIHMVVDADMSVAAAHDLAHRIEDHVARRLPRVRFLVHIEPAEGATLDRYADRGHAGIVISEHPRDLDRDPLP